MGSGDRGGGSGAAVAYGRLRFASAGSFTMSHLQTGKHTCVVRNGRRRRWRRRERGAVGAGVVGGGAGGELSEEGSLAAALLDRFAADGLQAPVFAQRRVSPGEFVFRHARYTATRNTVDASRDAAVEAVAAKMEAGLDLLAMMAVEDKLGSLMPEIIAFLHAAGIQLWVLMGAKRETAENFGYSAPLLAPSVRVVHVAPTRTTRRRGRCRWCWSR